MSEKWGPFRLDRAELLRHVREGEPAAEPNRTGARHPGRDTHDTRGDVVAAA